MMHLERPVAGVLASCPAFASDRACAVANVARSNEVG